MRTEFNRIGGRVGLVAAIVLGLAALALYLYSERAVPPETETDVSVEAESDSTWTSNALDPSRSENAPVGVSGEDAGEVDGATASAAATGSTTAEDSRAGPETMPAPEISLGRQQQLLREDLAVRLGPGQVEMIVEDQLLSRLVTTVNSLDGAPVPLRFRPLAHVPGLPRLAEQDGEKSLPDIADPRYRSYRAVFDRLDAVEMAELFDRYEPALEKAWQALGEDSGLTFRQRSIEILEHMAEFELPESRPSLHQPKVLYEYIDPSLEQLSWGRKILVRIGPAHAPAVQSKLAALAERLAGRGPRS